MIFPPHHSTRTPIGIKIVITGDTVSAGLDQVPGRIYELYSDYVMKNPFYTPEMPIRCEQFDLRLNQLMNTFNA